MMVRKQPSRPVVTPCAPFSRERPSVSARARGEQNHRPIRATHLVSETADADDPETRRSRCQPSHSAGFSGT